MIEFITTPEEEKKLTFGMVETNQFFISEQLDLCQKVDMTRASIIAGSDGVPYAFPAAFAVDESIRGTLPKVYKIRW